MKKSLINFSKSCDGEMQISLSWPKDGIFVIIFTFLPKRVVEYEKGTLTKNLRPKKSKLVKN